MGKSKGEIKRWRLQTALLVAVVMLAAAFGIVSADYIGPNRSYSYVSGHNCEYTARLYFRGTALNYYCTLRLTESSCNPSNKASYFTAGSCSWPASCTSANYSCSIWVSSDTPIYSYGSYPPATASGNFSCSTWGNNGWCRGGASLNVSGSEPLSGYSITRMEGNYDGSNTAAVSCPGSSCSFTPPLGSGTFYYWAVSSYGDTSSKQSLGYKYDNQAPSTPSFSLSGTSGSNGWYVSNVTVSASSSDAHSGIASVAQSCGANPCTISAEGTTTVNATATDNAGNTSSGSVTVKIDKTPPTISLSRSGTSGSLGWYRSDVVVSGSASDSVSGLASLSASCGALPCTITAEGTTTVNATATDNAGNTASTSTTVKIDKTPPFINVSMPSPDGQNGWYRSNVEVDLQVGDTVSGLQSWSTPCGGSTCSLTITSEGTTTLTASADDVAGNSNSSSVTVKLDKTPPSISLVVPSPNGQNGWFVTPPTLTVDGSDAVSGVALKQIQVDGGSWQNGSAVVGGDGTHNVSARVQDVAGNTSTASATVKVDTTPPSVAALVSGTSGQNGWYVSAVTVSAGVSDATSGVALAQVDAGSGWRSSASLGDGIHTVTLRGVDNAGNETITTTTIKVDTTPPQLTPQVPAADGQNGWYRSSVTLDASASDATSGLNVLRVQINGGSWQSLPVTLDGDGVYTVTFEAIDQAGNLNRQTRTLYVDVTPPTITPDLPAPGGLNGWYVQNVVADASADDATSSPDAVQVQVDDGPWQEPPVVITDGVHTLTVRAYDKAGNLQTWSTTVKVDTTPPTGVVVLSGVPGQDGWWRSSVDVSVSAEDAASGVQDALVRRVGDQDWQSNMTLSDGEYDLEVLVSDNAGWQITQTLHVRVDATPPTGEIATDNSGTVSQTVTLGGTVDDATSGVIAAEISTDGGQTWHTVLPQSGQQLVPVTGSGALAWSFAWDTTRSPSGNNSVILRVTDAAGNVYQTEKTFFVANALPAVGFEPGQWYVWEAGSLRVAEGDLPVIRVCLRVEDEQDRWPAWEQCWSSVRAVPSTFVWNRRFGDGTLAPVGEYRVVLSATDIILRTVTAVGKIVIPPVATPTPTSTPTPTETPTPEPPVVEQVVQTQPARPAAPTPTPEPTRGIVPQTAEPDVPKPSEAPRALLYRAVILLAGVGVFLAFSTASAIDRRPSATRRLAGTIERLRSINRWDG